MHDSISCHPVVCLVVCVDSGVTTMLEVSGGHILFPKDKVGRAFE